MLNWLSQTTLMETLTLLWVTAWGLIKLGEWLRGLKLRRRTEGARRSGEEFVFKYELDLLLEKHAQQCRHEARDIVNVIVGRLSERQDEVTVEVRRHRDWLIELQAHTGTPRKDRT